ncbi:MAG: pyrimidine 5'-nucleotidase [Anaerolineales bacterium]|jgi:pyrimidine 5'-nucleotidase|nr:pyrimidine 5'-nucleotidase [Anaerolineales bacterium]
MVYTTLFFDLDDTLYPPTTRLWEAIRNRMGTYMVERLNIPAEQVDGLRRLYLESYGTTLRGLQHFYPVDTEDYLHYVHNLPLAEYIQPDARLRPILQKLPENRWIFTNADIAHAQRVLQVLNLEDCFLGIIDVRAIGFSNKPQPEAYLKAMQIAQVEDPEQCILLDDALRNLEPAGKLGFTTILVNPNPAAATPNGFKPHFAIPDLVALPGIMPKLWESNHQGPDSRLRFQSE